jgi:hypothetical protein
VSAAGGHGAEALKLEQFDAATFPSGLRATPQVEYLRCYLSDLGAESLIEEPQYFDRDYLAEFAAFYSTSSKGYLNVCRRLHVFALPLLDLRSTFAAALGGDGGALKELNRSYLGFLVLRPLPITPFGRTVLKLYPERQPDYPRATQPARPYRANLLGLPLEVHGLAWQQQDRGVGACATVALWTMFHSSALDEHHAVPTTVEITRAAHSRWPLSRRVFPSDGLNIHQICEAIKQQGLQPAVLNGDQPVRAGSTLVEGFGKARFAASCAALIRSGYPVLVAARVAGNLQGEGHAVTIVGFRPGPSPVAPTGSIVEEDSSILHVYLHDDNLGPSVRFAIDEVELQPGQPLVAVLRADPPPPQHRNPSLTNPTVNYFQLVPTSVIAALPSEIRISSDYLNHFAVGVATRTAEFLGRPRLKLPGVSYSASFMRISEYCGPELGKRLSGRRLAKVRLALTNQARPMSLHVGVVRIGLQGQPLFDLLLDTSDSELLPQLFAHVMFQEFHPTWLLAKGLVESWGAGIAGF